MGKHSSNGLSYFNIDCVQEDNLNYIEAKHGISGYGVLVKLWRKIYMIHGYYCDWSEKNVYLFSKEVSVPVEQITLIIEDCFQEGIFSREMYDKFRILTSSGTQKRWLKIVTEAKRKNCKIEENFLLSVKTQEEFAKTPEELPKTPEDIPQRKEKEEKKRKNSAPAKPSLPKKVDKKKEEQPEPYWQALVNVWFAFGKEKFGEEPSFAKGDPKIFKRIIQLLKARATKKNLPWDEITAPQRLLAFLISAFQDPWLCKNFLLSHIENQFDKFIQDQGSAFQSKKVNGPAKTSNMQATFQETIANLINRYEDGKLITEEINPEIYDKLSSRGYIKVGTMDRMIGSSIEEKKRAAVIEFFKSRRQQEVPA